MGIPFSESGAGRGRDVPASVRSRRHCYMDQVGAAAVIGRRAAFHAVAIPDDADFQLVRHAMQWIPEVATNDVPGLQAILLLTQYIFLNPRMADLWLLTGLISQAVIDLGLHQELPNDARVSAYQRDMRRRLFWCAWEMEVGVCCIFLRPTSLPIRNIEVAFPLELDDTVITQSGVDRGGRVSKFTQRIICRFRLIEAEIVSVLWHGDPIPKGMTMQQWEQHCVDAMSQWRQEIYA
ncbi:MAG: fungal specific transcription factor domain-containing protein, partial [Hyphomicrobiales bacterium]